LQFESQHESALSKLQALEDTSKYQRREEEEIIVKEKPSFTVQLNGPTSLVEGQSAHYECRIEPYPDPNMKVEWFHNGKPLSTGHRYRTTCDFGFASLDVLTVYAEDSGTYTCQATNKLGSARSSINLDVKCEYENAFFACQVFRSCPFHDISPALRTCTYNRALTFLH